MRSEARNEQINSRKQAEWVYNLLVQQIKSGRTEMPIGKFSIDNMNDLAKVLDDIQNKRYTDAQKTLDGLPLPRPNGAETAFKLQARMIVASYKAQTSVLHGGSFFTWPSNGSRHYIANLARFIKEGKFDIDAKTFERDYLYKNIDKVGGRLSGMLAEFNVKKEAATVPLQSVQTPEPAIAASPRSE